MDFIHKLPFFLGGGMAILVGAISYSYGTATQTLYIRMSVTMVVFYILGAYVRSTLRTLHEEQEKKKALEAELLKEGLENEDGKETANEQGPLSGSGEGRNPSGSRIDIAVDGSEDEFEPLTVSQVLSTKLKD